MNKETKGYIAIITMVFLGTLAFAIYIKATCLALNIETL